MIYNHFTSYLKKKNRYKTWVKPPWCNSLLYEVMVLILDLSVLGHHQLFLWNPASQWVNLNEIWRLSCRSNSEVTLKCLNRPICGVILKIILKLTLWSLKFCWFCRVTGLKKKGLKSRLTLSQNKLKILLPFSHKGSQNLWPTLTLSSFLLYIELQITKLIECSKELPTSR